MDAKQSTYTLRENTRNHFRQYRRGNEYASYELAKAAADQAMTVLRGMGITISIYQGDRFVCEVK